jgi:hypothetical protein
MSGRRLRDRPARRRMRLKVDEILPREACDPLDRASHDALSVGQQGLGGAPGLRLPGLPPGEAAAGQRLGRVDAGGMDGGLRPARWVARCRQAARARRRLRSCARPRGARAAPLRRRDPGCTLEPRGAAMRIGASGVTAKLSARGDRSGHGMVENLPEGRAGPARRLAVRHL